MCAIYLILKLYSADISAQSEFDYNKILIFV